MREIKFRIWDEKSKQIFLVDQIDLTGDTGATVFNDDGDEFNFADDTLMQFTGLHDKNGKEIWEGDILGYRGEPVIIEYSKDMFHCKSTKYQNLSHGNYRLDTLRVECEVLGNIYENKELLP